MSIAITDEHRALAETASDFLDNARVLAANRALLTSTTEERPAFWGSLDDLGWLGLHIPENLGGSGYGLEELVVVVEELGRKLAPGPFVPTVVASAFLAAAAPEETRQAVVPGLVDGSTVAGVALESHLTLDGSVVSGKATVMGGELADHLVLVCGDDVVTTRRDAAGVTVSVPVNLDPSRRFAKFTFDATPVVVIPGGRRLLVDLARTILAAEAVGVARQCTENAASYARTRVQFGRVIGMFQAVKHHCANMAVATELATAATWDAARAAAHGGEQFSYAAAVAATLAGPAADLCANLSTQVHGGIAITHEHDAHLFMRRATVLRALLAPESAACEVTALTRAGVTRARSVDLPPEAEAFRSGVRSFADRIKGLDEVTQRTAMIAEGYAMPHWPTPWGRGAGAVEQLVIEQEFAAAGVSRPQYGITGWVILTLIQYATEDQVKRWVHDALTQDVIWCQLFSEPDAGSDAAGVKTKATRVDGGWLVNGQKVWTSGAHLAGFGFATVRTDPTKPKHQGITTMVIDMHAPGVEVRPLMMPTGQSEFNEVFFNDVFVPDDDVVGPIDGGWTVAHATLGNESVSIGDGQGGMTMPPAILISAHDAHPERLAGGEARLGRYASSDQAMAMLNLRSTHRSVAGGAPGPEGAITKLVLSENGHEAAAMLSALAGTGAVFLSGAGELAGMLTLMHRAMSIAGGTSEIKRNQIGERIVGLPRDPLIV